MGLYYSGYGYLGHHYPYAYAHAPLVHHAVSPYVYGARYYANSGGAVHIVKRDADAEPAADPTADAEPVADADADAYYAAYGYAYSPYVYRGYGYAHPISYARYYHPYAYAPYGYIRHLGKRSADAEPTADADADPYYYDTDTDTEDTTDTPMPTGPTDTDTTGNPLESNYYTITAKAQWQPAFLFVFSLADVQCP